MDEIIGNVRRLIEQELLLLHHIYGKPAYVPVLFDENRHYHHIPSRVQPDRSRFMDVPEFPQEV